MRLAIADAILHPPSPQPTTMSLRVVVGTISDRRFFSGVLASILSPGFSLTMWTISSSVRREADSLPLFILLFSMIILLCLMCVDSYVSSIGIMDIILG